MRTMCVTALVLCAAAAANGAVVVFSYPPSDSGKLIASSSVWEDGSDADMFAYESFKFSSDQDITAVQWRGGYIYDAQYGKVIRFTIHFYESTANDTQPHCGNPVLDETIYLAEYIMDDNAGETYVGTFGGTKMYDYSYTLSQKFTATADVKYWIKIEGYQSTYPDWGIAVGTGGDSSHFQFSAGWARFYFASGDTSFALLGPPPAIRGDMNCDGRVDFNDIDGFVSALVSQTEYETQYPDCHYLDGDINGDGAVNFNDIDGFVDCMINNGCL